MARPLRIEYPGAYYHVINRGNAGENIFLNDRDKEKFLEYLGTATERFSIIIVRLIDLLIVQLALKILFIFWWLQESFIQRRILG